MCKIISIKLSKAKLQLCMHAKKKASYTSNARRDEVSGSSAMRVGCPVSFLYNMFFATDTKTEVNV